MRDVARRYPDDEDAQTLYAEALMDLQPWDYYTVGGAPKGAIKEITARLEQVIAKNPNHPGACHYYIHAVEASRQPEQALPCAERLAELMPGAGHLVHMPAHIYMRVGRYADAAKHNEHALHADQMMIERRHFTGPYPHMYVTHNWHFLWFARMMQGQFEPSLEAARTVSANMSLEAVRAMPPLEAFSPTKYYALARFGRWDEVLQQTPPPPELRYTTAVWHYTRGLALAAKGKRADAKAERDSLAAIIAKTPAAFTISINSGKAVLAIADRHLRAELAVADGRRPEAVKLLREAAAIEDGLTYDEPPAWYWPMRQVLGHVLLDGGDAKGAEAAFREDLARNRENGWALQGLLTSLRKQGKSAEAAEIEQRLKQAWKEG
jgi:tetratricopeptide (TPR) repeat protein